MKKIVFVLLLLLTGCSLNHEMNLVINDNKQVNFSVLEVYDDELIDLAINDGEESSKEYTDEERWNFLEEKLNESKEQIEGFEISKYEDEKFMGYKYTISIDSIDSITSDDASYDIQKYNEISSSKLFKEENGIYTSKIYSSDVDQGEDLEYNLVFSVTLPQAPISHNANSVSEDGKTLTWNLKEAGNIEFQFRFDNEVNTNSNNNLIIGIVTVVLTGCIVFITILIIRKKQYE